MSSEKMRLTLRVWKQKDGATKGRFENYVVDDANPHMSFLELLDHLNEKLMKEKKEPIEFDHDCREGICGSCNLMINGIAHGPQQKTAACQLHMRHFKDGDLITVEPWRATAFPIIRDLVVDRTAFDRIMAAGGFVSVGTNSAPDANAVLIPKPAAELAMDFATCIGCGACVAACPNASASLFTGAKIAQFSLLPQGGPERKQRVVAMVDQMEKEGFGDCSNYAECEAVCPVGISIDAIARMRREYVGALRG
jgi:succinate dehydrogenase / fumarate reductase, iron-sulfur subunit